MMTRKGCYALLLAATWFPAIDAAERETLGPSSRRSAIVISEVMYHPLEDSAENLEFVELYNSGVQPVPLAGWRLSGDISFAFPAAATLAPGGFLVVAASPTALTSHYGLSGVLGPYTNALPNEGGTLRLRNAAGAVLWETDYDDIAPWPLTADGAGHSLVLARPSFGENEARAWEASARRGGSPGGPEPVDPPSNFEDLVFNEIGTTTNRFGDPPFVEFYNRAGANLNLSGADQVFITDDPRTNKVRVSTTGLSVLGARTAKALSWANLGLTLKPGGGTLYLIDALRNRVLDMVRYTDQSPQFALGRVPEGATRWGTVTPTPLLTPLPAIDPRQRLPFRSDVIINEIMYHPITGAGEDQYVELFNRNAGSEVDVSGWKFVDGLDLTLPSNTVIPPNGYLVVAKNASHLRTNYSGLLNVVGDFGGQLSDRGERIALARPESVSASSGNHLDAIVYVVMDEITYGTGGAWGQWSDGGGASLELASPEGDNDYAGHWRDSAEPTNTPWTLVRESGPLELGETRSTPNVVELLLLGEGECLVDDVSVIVGGAERVANGTLNSGANGWVFQGTHEASAWRATGGVGNSGCLHVRATALGDTFANRVYVPLTTTLIQGQTATISAQIRHLRGNPDVLLRLRGNWLDAGATLRTAPGAYGSPGRPNAAAASLAGPAIYNVRHQPIVPNANQSIVVTAQFNGTGNTPFIRELLYRIDPSASYLTVPLNDDGSNGDIVAGDDLWSATIPGQPAGRLAAFRVRARTAAPAVTNHFPSPQPLYPGDPFGQECLVRFGDPRPTGSFGNYRIWLTQATHDRWATRGTEHHGPLNTTFVYGDQRVIYTVASGYAGAESIYDTPTGIICGYDLGFPADERLLGSREMLLDWGQSDDAGQRENLAFWIAEQMGLPFLYRRHVTLIVNGFLPTQRPLTGYHPLSAKVYWDAQEPNGDFVKQWFPEDDNNGELYKLHHLFFGSDPANLYGFHLLRLQHFVDSTGQRHQSTYRWHWRRRAADQGATELRTVFRLLDAVNAPEAGYTANVEALVNVEQWMRLLAFERVIGNVDSLGWDNGHNMYGYFSPQLGWHLLPYDCELSLATPTGGWYDTSPTKDLFSYTYDDGEFKGDHTLGRMKQHPAFQRAYWRAFQDALDGPLVTANFLPVMQRYQAALTANNVPVAGPAVIQGYLETRREYIRNQLTAVQANFSVFSPPNGATLNTNLVTLSGSAPIQAAGLQINGQVYPVTWTSPTTWSAQLVLAPGFQTLIVQALNSRAQPIAGMNATRNLQINVPPALPSDLVINEIMYHPATPGAQFLELHNRSATTALDLSGWRINGVDFTFPTGACVAPGGFTLVAADRLVFGQTYGFDIPVAGVFPGSFDEGGETLTLRRPVGPDELTVDTVTYDDDLPWPAAADGRGPSLQLSDPALDNNRVSHWSVGTNAVAAGETNLLIAMNATWKFRDDGVDLQTAWREPGYDDQAWPAGAALLHYEVGPLPAPKNTPLRLGPTTYYFRRPFAWDSAVTGVALRLTTIVDDGAVVYLNGQEAFRLGGPPGPMTYDTFSDRNIGEAAMEGPFDLPLTNLHSGLNLIAVEVHQRTNTSSDMAFGLSLEVVQPPNGGTGGLPYTPGAPNQVPSPGSVLPLLWLNELQVINATGPSDSRGQREPWLELYNAGSALDLTGFSLSNDPSNLTRFPFPPGTTIGSGEFRLVWLDGAAADHTSAEWHASFRLQPNDEMVLLSHQTLEGVKVVDYLTCAGLEADQAVARVPDGAAGPPRVLDYGTAGASNSGAPPLPAVYLNEFLAANTLWPDPADGDADDFVELYNASDRPVSLAGYSLTDRLGVPRKFVIPDGVLIGPHNFLLAWADEEETQMQANDHLHLNFKLNDEGEVIALFAPDGRLVDSYAFGAQDANTSLARWPDGPGAFTTTTNATPGMRNKLNGFTLPPLTVEAEVLPNSGVKIYVTTGYSASVLCADRLDANMNWSQVNGRRGYDPFSDREWVLDVIPPGNHQRFYRAIRLP